MKKLLFSLAVLFVTTLSAQDVIIKKSGEEIKAKVIEITPTEIKYKQADNLDGPLYSLTKAEVFKVNYANGKSDFYGNVTGKLTMNMGVCTPPTSNGHFDLHEFAETEISSEFSIAAELKVTENKKNEDLTRKV